MKVKGILGIGFAMSGEGAGKRQSSDCRRSAEPDAEVLAREPC